MLYDSLVAGIDAEPATYRDDFAAEVREQLFKAAAVHATIADLTVGASRTFVGASRAGVSGNLPGSRCLTRAAPLHWDADFLLGERADDQPERYVLCEINVSSVAPFPDAAVEPLLNAVRARLHSRSVSD